MFRWLRVLCVGLVVLSQAACVHSNTIKLRDSQRPEWKHQLETLRPGSRISIVLKNGQRIGAEFREATESVLVTARASYPLGTVESVTYKEHRTGETSAAVLAAILATVVILPILWVNALKNSHDPEDK